MRRSLSLLLLAPFLLTACAKQVTEEQEPIKIGVIRPLSGAASVYGDPAAKATVLAAEQINATGGINGRDVQLIVEDGQCEGRATANATNKLINTNGVTIILGGGCSTESLSIAPIANEKKVLQLATLTSSDAFTNAGPYSFRNFPASVYYDTKLGEIAFKQGARKLAALNEQKDFPAGASTSFKKGFEAAGGTIASIQEFLSTERDFRTGLTKIKNSGIDAIYFGSQGPELAILFYRQLHELGMDTLPIHTNAQG